jgi:hypothetical protein
MALKNANEFGPLARKVRRSQELPHCYFIVKELMRIEIGSLVWGVRSREL